MAILQEPSPPPPLRRKALQMPPSNQHQFCGRRRKLVSTTAVLEPNMCISPTVVEPDQLALSPQRRMGPLMLLQPTSHSKHKQRRTTSLPQRRPSAPDNQALDQMRVHSLQVQEQNAAHNSALNLPSQALPDRQTVVRFADTPPTIWQVPHHDDGDDDKASLYYSTAELKRFQQAERARQCAQQQYQRLLNGDLSALLPCGRRQRQLMIDNIGEKKNRRAVNREPANLVTQPTAANTMNTSTTNATTTKLQRSFLPVDWEMIDCGCSAS